MPVQVICLPVRPSQVCWQSRKSLKSGFNADACSLSQGYRIGTGKRCLSHPCLMQQLIWMAGFGCRFQRHHSSEQQGRLRSPASPFPRGLEAESSNGSPGDALQESPFKGACQQNATGAEHISQDASSSGGREVAAMPNQDTAQANVSATPPQRQLGGSPGESKV